jgi:hypothetical protein
MRTSDSGKKHLFGRGVVVISIDTEQIWGYLDLTDEAGFCRRFPNSVRAHDRLLDCLCAANIAATWTVVGALALSGTSGRQDPRFGGLPEAWVAKVPAGDESSAPLWYRSSFVKRLHRARVAQDVGLHGGLTHLMWTGPETSAKVAQQEFEAGQRALEEIGIQPRSFVFPRDLVTYLFILATHGIRSYRGRAPILSEKLGLTLAGRIARLSEELSQLTPPPVWPEEILPGLWNIPASMPLYSLGKAASRLAPLRSRLNRVRRGIAAAARQCGIFHLCFHPQNLVEAPWAFSTIETILAEIAKWRDSGEVEIITMNQVVDRVSCDHEGSASGDKTKPDSLRQGIDQVNTGSHFEACTSGCMTALSGLWRTPKGEKDDT